MDAITGALASRAAPEPLSPLPFLAGPAVLGPAMSVVAALVLALLTWWRITPLEALARRSRSTVPCTPRWIVAGAWLLWAASFALLGGCILGWLPICRSPRPPEWPSWS